MTDVPQQNDTNADDDSVVTPSPPNVAENTPSNVFHPVHAVRDTHAPGIAKDSGIGTNKSSISVRLVLPEKESSKAELITNIHEPLVPGVEVEARIDNEQMRIRIQRIVIDPEHTPAIEVFAQKAHTSIFFPILSCVRICFHVLRLLSMGYWLRKWAMSKGRRLAVACIDWYILVWLLLELAIIISLEFGLTCKPLVVTSAIISVYRILELMQVYFNILLFDPLQHYEAGEEYFLYSSARSVLIAILSYLELIACYAIFYVVGIPSSFSADSPIATVGGALYFSTITVTTLGYGEITPVGTMRFACMTEAILGVLFMATIIARFLNFLPAPKGDPWRR